MNELYLSVLGNLDWRAFSTHWILMLVHCLWQGAAIGLLTAVLLVISRHASARTRHAICLFTLASFVPCLVVTWMCVDVSAYSVVESAPDHSSPPVADIEPQPGVIPVPVSDGRFFPRESTIENTQPPASQSNLPTSAGSVLKLSPAARRLLARVAPVVAVGYFTGVLLFLLRTCLGLWGGRRLRNLSQPIVDSELLSLIQAQARRIGLMAAPPVAYCAQVAVPTVIGLLKPLVLLPATLVTGLETEQLAAILSHEFAHIRRHDLLVNLLQRVLEAVLFFHPVVWWLSRRISFERENCCDDLAAAAGFGNLQYAGALLRMAELSLPLRNRKFASQLVALSADGQNTPYFSRRIERLLNIPSTPRLAVSRLSAVSAVVLSLISIGVLAQIADQKPDDREPEKTRNVVSANDVHALDEVAEAVPDDEEQIPTAETLPGLPASEVSTTAETEDETPERPSHPYFDFLKSYPKLYALSLEMTEVQFLTIVHQEKLKLRMNPDGPSYWIPTDDGHIVIVMFGNNGNKCSGIQRIRGEVPEAETPPAIVDSKGIYWSEFVSDGFRVGAKLLAKEGQLSAGEKLVVQYFLMNEADESKTISLVPSTPVFPTLGTGNRIELSLFPGDPEVRKFSIDPGQSLGDPSHRVEIDTTGFPPGAYHVMARNFFWRPDPENVNQQSGFPARVVVPLTIAAKEGNPQATPAEGTTPAADDIDWGKPVAGLQVGSRLLGDSTLFDPGSELQVQLFVRNVTRNPIEVSVFLPHPINGWLMNVENPQGDRFLLERTYISVHSPQESFVLQLAAGETVPLTGAQYPVNGAQREIKNSAFRIERKKPDAGFWKGGLLVSQGGEYRAIHTVSMKRDDIPGVRLSIDSGQSRFQVPGPELKNPETSKEVKQKPEDEGQASIRSWKARLVDGASGDPLAGIKVRVYGAVAEKKAPQPLDLVSDLQGMISVPLRDGTASTVLLQSPDWWSAGYLLIGQLPVVSNSADQNDTPAEPDPDTPRELPLWRGVTVKGRLLYPDKSPAGGVRLNVGVYIHNVEWKKRLGMDLTWYSWDHGEWPNWSRQIMTENDGTFTITVPPEEARSWVRIGTTGLGFGAINPDQIDDQGTGKALATCVPFEAELGGNSPGFGYETVAIGNDNAAINFGTLQLKAGVRVRGRVVDADGNGLAGVYLTTAGPHGPHAGRSAWSGQDGRFEFLPVEADSLMINPDARLRDADRKVISREVQAVFINQAYYVPAAGVELIIQAVPHVELEFDWIDRRADKTAPVSYYGDFNLFGHYPVAENQLVYWQGETNLVERDGRHLLVAKVPRELTNPTLVLVRDRVVTASYEDETGLTSGPGRVELGDINTPLRRIIYGDEPAKPE